MTIEYKLDDIELAIAKCIEINDNLSEQIIDILSNLFKEHDYSQKEINEELSAITKGYREIDNCLIRKFEEYNGFLGYVLNKISNDTRTDKTN